MVIDMTGTNGKSKAATISPELTPAIESIVEELKQRNNIDVSFNAVVNKLVRERLKEMGKIDGDTDGC